MRNPDRETVFRFKRFEVSNCLSAMKVGTDGVLLGAWAFAAEANRLSPESAPLRIWDIGCGTGVISLMMAQRFPHALITGVDIDPDAATEAACNFNNSPWPDRLNVKCLDFTGWDCTDADDPLSGREPYKADLLISNPPFFSNGALSADVTRNLARHDGSLSVDRLLSQSARMMPEGGKLAVILPMEQLDTWKFQTVLNGLFQTRLCIVSTTPSKAPRRFMSEVCRPSAKEHPNHTDCDESVLTIHLASGDYSPEYKKLVEPFYIKL